jgi:hypothetical protein
MKFQNSEDAFLFLDPKIGIKSAVRFCGKMCLNKLKVIHFLVGICMGGTLGCQIFENSEYELHQVCPKDSGSQIFSFLKAETGGEGKFRVRQRQL